MGEQGGRVNMATPAPAPVQVPEQAPDPVKIAANALASAADCDVFLYNAEIRRPYDREVFDACAGRNRRENVSLILVTEGGDPDAAYRIARCFQQYYGDGKFTCIIPGYCKSAGTLLAIGAHELMMSDAAELGPIDVQMSKRDEIEEWQSGLTLTSAIRALHEHSFAAFEHFFLTTMKRSKKRVTFKTATDIAAKLTAGLFGPVFAHIDPMVVGESFRATSIALHYGIRLDNYSDNLSDGDSLDYLISRYPTHGFVIDRSEAETLFTNVKRPEGEHEALLTALGTVAYDPQTHKAKERREFLSDEVEKG
jgi:Serine dehydrogenase proteinase